MALRELIYDCFPECRDRYIEVCGGAGWVLFYKPPGPFEVYNDYNGFLSNFFLAVREQPCQLLDALNFRLNARAEFDAIRQLVGQTRIHYDGITPNVQVAANFYQLIRHSYASGTKSFAAQPHSLLNDFPLIEAAYRRLAGVIIENRDYAKIIQLYDRADSFFYIDPPYLGTEDMYQNIGKQGFTMDDHIHLRDLAISMDGKFIMSYNDDPRIRDLYDVPGIHILPVARLHNMRQRYEGGAEYREILIGNFDLKATRLAKNTQLTLFESAGGFLH